MYLSRGGKLFTATKVHKKRAVQEKVTKTKEPKDLKFVTTR